MIYKVLIIDDEHENENRKSGYKRLENEINKFDLGFNLSFDILTHPNELQSKIGQNSYVGVILDAVLDQKWDYSISNALPIIGVQIPIAILSKRWDETNSEQITEALKKPNCRTFLNWRDIDPDGDGQIDYTIRSLQGMIADHLGLDPNLKLNPYDPIRILHISDMQVGGIDKTKLRLETNQCADVILAHWGQQPPTFVACTGDVSEHGKPSQYEEALEWITYFFKQLGLGDLPAKTLLYVPGNHDVNLRLAAGARVEIKDDSPHKLADKILDEDLMGYAYAPYRNFIQKTCDRTLLSNEITNHNFAWVESRFRHLGVLFYGVNTAQPPSAFSSPDREVDADALSAIDNELSRVLRDYKKDKPIVIGLGHHSPISLQSDDAVSNPDVFNTFFRGNIKTGLFLHGHRHTHKLSYNSDDGIRLIRSCATTLTKGKSDRDEDTLRGFNLLTLERGKHVVKSLNASSYAWINNQLQELPNNTKEWETRDDGMFLEKQSP